MLYNHQQSLHLSLNFTFKFLAHSSFTSEWLLYNLLDLASPYNSLILQDFFLGKLSHCYPSYAQNKGKISTYYQTQRLT